MSYIDELFKSGVWGTKEPTEPTWVKWIHRNLSENHCPECLKLDGCYFLKEKAPKHPHHPYCHCLLNSISYNTVLKNAKAVSDYSKYDPYLFNPEYAKKHGKDKMFKSWGFDITDSNICKRNVKNKHLRNMLTETMIWENLINTDKESALESVFPERIQAKWFRTSQDGWYNKAAE